MRKLILAAAAAILAYPAWAQAPAPAAAPTSPALITRPGPVARPMPPTAPAAAPAAAPATAPVAAPRASGSKVDINAATAAQLDALPEIGPVRSKAIVDGRPYTDLEDLVSKKVLTQALFERLKPELAIANINTSTAAQLQKSLPGVGEVRSKAIVAGRPYATPQDLVTKKILTDAVFEKIKDIVAW